MLIYLKHGNYAFWDMGMGRKGIFHYFCTTINELSEYKLDF